MKSCFFLIPLIALSACGNNANENNTGNQDSLKVEEFDTLPPFISIHSNFTTDSLILPEGFSYTILFQEEFDSVTRADGKKFPAKGYHDLSVFIPDKNSPETKGKLYISHESKYANADLGDGGGATIFDIELIDGTWKVVSEFHHVDFSNVGGTNRNCGGSISPNGTVFTCEEVWAPNTSYLWAEGKGHTDTSFQNGRPLWQNMGYMVEVDPQNNKAVKKHWKMGRFVHEDIHFTPDGKTAYLTDDNSPGIFFKYETKKAFDYNDGQLYAYKQAADGESGEWITLPMDTLSLINCTKIAMEKGASMFIRHEWIQEINGKLYITETGEDNFDWADGISYGGTVPNYISANLNRGGTQYDDVFGRIVEFDPSTNKMRSYLEGGFFSDSSGVFSNPDCNTSVSIGTKTYMVICEDINWYDRGRAGAEGENGKYVMNEVYFLDMSIQNPTVDDLMRFAVMPKGSEGTGAIFLPDGSMILNIMHPSAANPVPFNRSCTVLIEGFRKK
jgi:secreted PhoX family phosphatase